MWLMALDVGDVRVGVALLDSDAGVPLPHDTFIRAKGEAEKKILSLCEERTIEKILVGLPLNDDGSENEQSEKVRNFVRRLAKRIETPIELIDEYASSEEARQRLYDSGVRNPEVGRIDALAASILIERYLNKSLRAET